jgi:hypothetical protein
VVIGGGLAKLNHRLLDGVQGVIEDWEAQSALIQSLELRNRVRLIPADAPVAALGAAHLGAR